jgi:sigma-B regulation protein RsbU (phosphoserine phosphatase)
MEAQLFEELIDSISDAVITIDQDRRIVIWNNGAKTIFGYDKVEIREEDLEVIMPPEYRQKHRQGYTRYMNNIPNISSYVSEARELEGLRKNGERFPVEVTHSLLKLSNEKFYITAILRDITERKRAQQVILETQRRLTEELNEAAAYVKSLLPPPLDGEVRADWRFVPSTQLGGDSFGYHWIDPEHFAMYLLDVCGHGVEAALLSVTVMNMLHAETLPHVNFRDPSQVLETLNEIFQMENHCHKYFSIWYGVYNKTTRRIDFASAGHPPAILVTSQVSETTEMELLRTRGMCIGCQPGLSYESEHRYLKPSSKLFIFSDGVYEITKTDGTEWTLKEFTELMREFFDSDFLDLDRILRYVQGLRGSESLEDDFSILQLIFG